MDSTNLKPHHLEGVTFLYRNYKRKLKGGILNEEDDMNMQMQVSAFLNEICNKQKVKSDFLSLVICPEHLVPTWHYELVNHGCMKVKIITQSTCPEDFDEENNLVLLLSFSDLKLADYLLEYNYFIVVVDKLDEVAKKLILRKLSGEFNIGLTTRSFYTNPDTKLQWTMLNWSSPGCVGKLLDFYEIENDNFANFRDNYRQYWLRLTWNFCETFKKITKEVKEAYDCEILAWAKSNKLKIIEPQKAPKRNLKRKLIILSNDELKNENENSSSDGDVIIKCETAKKSLKIEAKHEEPELDIKSENFEVEELKSKSSKEKVSLNRSQLPIMDESPILTSIIKNFEKIPSPTVIKKSPSSDNSFNKIEENSILLSIINNTTTVKSENEINKNIDEPCSSKSQFHESAEDFWKSLVFKSPPLPNNVVKFDKSTIEKKVIVPYNRNSDSISNLSDIDREIKHILDETDGLLKND